MTKIDTAIIREIARFCMPPGVTGLLIEVRNAHWVYGGAAHVGRRRVGLRFQRAARYPRWIHPYQRGQHKGRKWWIASLTEMMVYITAHELRHMFQQRAKSHRGYVWGARGRYSEIDADAYAIRKVREWRRS